MDKQIHSIGAPGFLPARIGNELPEHMTSLEMAELVEKRHDNVKRTIDTLADQGIIVRPQIEDVPETDAMGRQRVTQVYKVGERDSYVVVARLSPEFTARLVDYWQKHRNDVPRLPTTAEAFASVFSMVADQERRQAVQVQQIKAIEAKVDQVAQAHVILDKLPSDCEYITVIRKRMNKQYGLSETVVDTVMRNSPYAPTTRALVRNQHVEAAGAHNQGFSKKEVSAVFRRFVDECQMVSATMATHPFVEGRFKLTGKAGA